MNVWFALVYEDHVHRQAALAWWRSEAVMNIGLTRHTQLGLLRLSTTAAAMNGQPLTMAEAWDGYDSLLRDERVALFAEPVGLEMHLRRFSNLATASPKLWADAYLLAFAVCHQAKT